MKKIIIYIQILIEILMEKLKNKIADIKFNYKNGCYSLKRWCDR